MTNENQETKENYLEKLTAEAVRYGAKSTAFFYPGYAGVLSEMNDTRYFDQLVDSWPAVLVFGVTSYLLKRYKIFEK